MNTAGLIFSNIHDSSIPELTRMRTMASVPFGCRYRLVDFALSNMVNSNISKVGIITHYNYRSLLDHIGNGKDWDLARRSGGIKILPPFITAYENAAGAKSYSSRLEALMEAMNFISRCTEEYMVLSDCDAVCNIDFSKVIQEHIKTGADITIVTKKVPSTRYKPDSQVMVVKTARDDDGKLADISELNATHTKNKFVDISTNMMVVKRKYLQNAVLDSTAHGYTSFEKDILLRNIDKANFRVYKYDGIYEIIDSMAGYFACSMDLLEADSRNQLFGNPDRPIMTKVRNSPPARYSAGSLIQNSLIADGCEIEGIVENSIIFRGVHIGKGSHVKNCVLLQDTYIGNNTELECVVTDKDVLIKDGRRLAGHKSLPFYIGKGASV